MNVINGHALTTGMRWESEWRCRGGNGRAAKKQNKSRQTKTGSYRPPPSTAALMGLDSFRPQGRTRELSVLPMSIVTSISGCRLLESAVTSLHITSHLHLENANMPTALTKSSSGKMPRAIVRERQLCRAGEAESPPRQNFHLKLPSQHCCDGTVAETKDWGTMEMRRTQAGQVMTDLTGQGSVRGSLVRRFWPICSHGGDQTRQMWLSRSVVDINLMIKPENITLLTMGLKRSKNKKREPFSVVTFEADRVCFGELECRFRGNSCKLVGGR
ncbi:Uncharacterized protein HZ326_3428 [Fusarium oxysporum f. sp. albedinis]|nr:Uncharacterized protein HZ326_3428 [Fusarium oxysporum f. sp. albedinis]